MKEPPDCHDQRKSQIEDDAIARAEELDGERTITQYLQQKLHVKGEHSLLETIDNTVSKIDQLTRERDSYKNRNELEFINMKAERDEARAAAAVMRDALQDCSQFPLGEDLHFKVCSALDLCTGPNLLSALKECVEALEGVDSIGFCECDDQYGEGKCLWCECKSALTKAQEALR